MKWDEIRQHHPEQWLLVEALKAHTEGGQRELERLAVLGSYDDSSAALRAYAEHHRSSPDRELYVFHTSRETVRVGERVRLEGSIRTSTCSCVFRFVP